MTVTKRNLFGGQNFDNGQPGVNQDNGQEPPASTIGTSVHGDAAAYTEACTRAVGEKPGGSAGFGLGGDTDTGFSTSSGDGGPGDLDGDTPSQAGPGGGKGIAGELPMVSEGFSHGGESSDTGSDTSGYGKVL